MYSAPPFRVSFDPLGNMERDMSFYHCRDTFLGSNFAPRIFRRALRLASESSHPWCRWLHHLFLGKEANNLLQVLEVLQAEKDAEALCLASCLLVDARMLRRAATMGSAYAQALLVKSNKDFEENFQLACSAASQGSSQNASMLNSSMN
jgi:hypothetical protein